MHPLTSPTRFLIIGLGSMGKRRIRCLHALGLKTVAGVDAREDRRTEAATKYGIEVFADVEQAWQKFQPQAILVCVPPDVHHIYVRKALERSLPCFVEASVVDTGFDEISSLAIKTRSVVAPSATMCFHPAIRRITELVSSGALGTISNFLLHSGQYLPDWHVYEAVKDFYVSKKETGGAREIVPFELTWVCKALGYPQRVAGNYRKTISIQGGEAIDDTYNCLLDYGTHLASITVDVVSRHATRRLIINGSHKQLRWDWDWNHLELWDPAQAIWEKIPYDAGSAAEGYNANIGEAMYVDEIKNFLEAAEGKRPFMNNLADDWRVLKLLYAIEESNDTGKFVRTV